MSLREGWTAHTDDSGGTFYANVQTGESSWEFPAAEAPTYADALPEGWAEHQDPGSGKAFYYNAGTNETSWERPAAAAAAPPAAVADPSAALGGWSTQNSYTVGTQEEMAAADAQSGGLMMSVLLDTASYSSVVSTIAQLEANQVVGQDRGYVIIWSNSKQMYFLLWRNDRQYEAFTQLKIDSDDRWWTLDMTKELGGPGSEGIFSGKAHLLDYATYTSCTKTVDALNTSQVPGAFEMGFCVMFSQSQQQYVLLYASGKQEVAFSTLGLSEESAAAG